MAGPSIPSGPSIPDNVDGTSGSGTWDNGTLGSGTWSYDATTQILTISGTGVTPDYSSSANIPWYSLLPNIDYSSLRVTAIVENGITGLGARTFSTMSIESITLPNGLKTIGASCFEGIVSLSEIVLPSSVNYIGASAFNGCRTLVNIYFKSTSAPTMGTYAFVLPTTRTHSANVYTVGWGSDSVFTESIRNNTTASVTAMKRYTNFTYYTWTPPADETTSSKIPVNVNGSWVDAVPYVNVNGTWKEVTVYMNVNGTWKETV